jgi:hypothetical protein
VQQPGRAAGVVSGEGIRRKGAARHNKASAVAADTVLLDAISLKASLAKCGVGAGSGCNRNPRCHIVGASMARPCGFPVGLICRVGCGGRSMTAPTNDPFGSHCRHVAGGEKAFPFWGEGGAPARRMRGKCPEGAPSSVTCGDSFPQRGKPYRRFPR